MQYTQNDFTLPKLVVLDAQNQYWALDWYYTTADGGRIRIRKTFGLNRIKSKRQRRREFERKAQEIYTRMLQGQHPFLDVAPGLNLSKDAGLVVAVLDALKIIGATSKHTKTISNYNSYAKTFMQWCKKVSIDKVPVSNFSVANAQRFLDFLLIEKKYSQTTYNNYAQFLHAIFERLKKRGYLVENVWKNTERRKDEQTKFGPYSVDEKRRIIAYIVEFAPELLLPVLLIYYCLFRPVELTRLQVKHFDFKQGKIILSAGTVVKKNNQDIVKAIPDVFISELAAAIGGLENEIYLFGGPDLKPGAKPTLPKYIQEKYLKVLKALDINSKVRRLYSWKDTAVCDLLDAGFDLANIQAQAAHERSEQTIHYARLKQNGPREHLKKEFPKIST